MEQLIFIAVIVVFTILDGIAKKKKKEAEAQAAQGGGEGWEWEPVGEIPPASDRDPSHDIRVDDYGIPGEPLSEYAQPYGGAPKPGEPEPETLIPKDVWEEIAALAAGRPTPPPEPAPVPVPYQAPKPVDPRRPERIPVRPDHRVHDSHGGFGTPPSERLSAMDLPSDHADPGLTSEVRGARQLLTGGGMSLRKAVILQEVLGQPVSLRED